jgi:hypothetical protein
MSVVIGIVIYVITINAAHFLTFCYLKRQFMRAAFQDPLAIKEDLQVFFQSQIDDDTLYSRTMFEAMQEAFQRGERLPKGRAGDWIRAQYILLDTSREWNNRADLPTVDTPLDRLLRFIPVRTRTPLLGDLQEIFEQRAERDGKARAKAWYAVQVARVFATSLLQAVAQRCGGRLFDLLLRLFRR